MGRKGNWNDTRNDASKKTNDFYEWRKTGRAGKHTIIRYVILLASAKKKETIDLSKDCFSARAKYFISEITKVCRSNTEALAVRGRVTLVSKTV